MKNISIWQDLEEMPSFSKLTSDYETDVLIIGGGIAGILCGYELSKRNIRYLIVEKDQIASKTTSNTTAFITAFHETLYQDLINDKGISKAKEYLELNLKAINDYYQLSKEYDIDYQEVNATLYSSTNHDKILKEQQALEKLGYQVTITKDIPIDAPIALGLTYSKQAVINPLKLIKNLSQKLNIFEQTKIVSIKNNIAIADNNYQIKFKHLILATNYPILNKSTLLFMKLIQKRSYVVAVKNIKVEGTYFDIEEKGLYFRGYNDYLIIGGNDRFTKKEHNSDFKTIIEPIIKNNKIDYYWSGQDCFTLDGVPYIGKFDVFHPNRYIITGFGLWGFNWSMISSKLISDMIEGKEQNSLVNPMRFVINKQLGENTITSIKNLLTFKKPRCAHLGCVLKFNPIEKTWECPCHGSLYDREGNLLYGPAQNGIKWRNKV